MEQGSMSQFELNVDGKVIGYFSKLSDAQTDGEKHAKQNIKVHIESLAALAPSKGWRYDFEIESWVETALPI
jgi:hypothetical protein